MTRALSLPLVAVPIVLVALAFSPFFGQSKGHGGVTRKAYDPKTGIGRGAPGFQTNVARVAIPPDLAARIRAGEEVSADEITQALEDVRKGTYKPKAEREREEWLPAGTSNSTKQRKTAKR